MKFDPEKCPLVIEGGWAYERGTLKRDVSGVFLRVGSGMMRATPSAVAQEALAACALCVENIVNDGGMHLVAEARSSSQTAKLTVKVVERE